MYFYIKNMLSDVYCNPMFLIGRRQNFTVIKLHVWFAPAKTMHPLNNKNAVYFLFIKKCFRIEISVMYFNDYSH